MLPVFDARQCNSESDRCRGTVAYMNSGQNVGQTSSAAVYQKVEDVIHTVINTWFAEKDNDKVIDH